MWKAWVYPAKAKAACAGAWLCLRMSGGVGAAIGEERTKITEEASSDTYKFDRALGLRRLWFE